ncbi:beta-ketoacyl reductase, partial [Streptomyces sp. RY43-2]
WETDGGMTEKLGEADLRRMSRAGIGAVTAEEGVALLDTALHDDRYPTLLPLRLDMAGLRSAAAADPAGVPSLLRELVDVAPARPRAAETATTGAGVPADESPAQAATLAERAADAHGPERRRLLLEFVCDEVADVLGHARGHRFDPDRGFLDLGFDSLTAVELRNRVNAASGLRLPATLVFDYPAPAVLADHLDAELPRSTPGRDTATSDTSATSLPDPAAVLAQLTRLEMALSLAGLADTAESDEVSGQLNALRALIEGGTTKTSDPGTAPTSGADTGPATGPEAGSGSGEGPGDTDILTASAEELFDLLDRESRTS